MLKKRIIPTLLIKDGSLIKTSRFKNPVYLGDPCNTVRIFNELAVDEILLLDIGKRVQKKCPDFELLKDIASEAFIPLAYGGGVRTLNDAKTLFRIGYEKIVLNSLALDFEKSVTEFSREFGAQAIVASIDYKKSFFGKLKVFNPYAKKSKYSLGEYAKRLEALGAGELLVTNVDREGTWSGLDVSEVSKELSDLNIPIIFSGGAQDAADVELNLSKPSVDAIGIGNVVVFQKRGCGVLVNFPFNTGRI